MNPDELYDLLDQAKQEEKEAYALFKEQYTSIEEQMEFLFCQWLRTNRMINIMISDKIVDEV